MYVTQGRSRGGMGPDRGSRGVRMRGATFARSGRAPPAARRWPNCRALTWFCRSTATMANMSSRRTKAADDDFAQYLREREQTWAEPVLSTPDNFMWILQGEPRRGRPFAFFSNDATTFQSKQAAAFINNEMKIFRARNQVSRVPGQFRKELWKIAERRYPDAVESAVFEYIRMNKKRL